MTTMLDSLSAAMDRAGMTAHREAARPAESRGEGQKQCAHRSRPTQSDGTDRADICRAWPLCEQGRSCISHANPRRMFAVTVALSEPADGSPLDWSETVASVLRLAFANTSVHVIDTWRNDQ